MILHIFAEEDKATHWRTDKPNLLFDEITNALHCTLRFARH